ncbi:MAG: hypothetical protein RL701_5070, partial [Pseudomonadota bacterium]
SDRWGATANFHEFAFGLAYRDDHFYATLATAVAPGGKAAAVQNADRGTVMRIERRTGVVEFIARGLRTPNGIGFGPDDALFVTDNEGDWLPANKLVHVQRDAFYGSYTVVPERARLLPVTQPVAWLPVGETASSPSQPVLFEHGPYTGQLLYGDVTYGGLSRVSLQRHGDTYQGCVMPFSQGLEAGVNRTLIGPDGAIYVGGIGNPGDWADANKLWYGLQRLGYTGAPTFELLDVQVSAKGIALTLSEAMHVADGAQPSDYALKQWKYVPTAAYGGPKVDEHAVPIAAVRVSPDRRHIWLATNGLHLGHVFELRFANPPVAESGRELWATSTWCTVNALPDLPPPEGYETTVVATNTLSRAELDSGWRLLFDGKSLRGWSGFRNQAFSSAWQVRDGALTTRGTATVDLVSDERVQDFELAFEWNADAAANSGVFYRVGDQHSQLWQNGPELQLLDDERAEDREQPAHRAGSAYDLYAPRHAVARPAGTYNHARIIAKGTHVEHWLNGHKVVEYDTTSAEWKRQLAASKFATVPEFGTVRAGSIALQHHGSGVSFRNIKLRSLSAPGRHGGEARR